MGELEEVQQILQLKTLDLNCVDYNGNTALQMAAGNGHVQILEALLGANCDPNKANKSGNTPLHWAALNGHLDACKALISTGKADSGLKNEFGRRPFDEALAKTPAGSELCEYLARLTDMSKDDADLDEKAKGAMVEEKECDSKESKGGYAES